MTWDGGGFRNLGVAGVQDAYAAALPEACSVTSCDEFRLKVALPPDVWSNTGDGVKVGIRWIHEEDAEFNLYVYGPDGQLAAKSDGVIASDGESLLIKNAQNGDYRVVVTNVFWDGGCGHDASGECGSEPQPPSYDGLAEVYRAPAIQPLRDLLPNLIPLPTETVTLRIGSYYGDPENVIQDGTYADNAPSCYPEEMAPVDVVTTGDLTQGGVTQQEGARRCLRFDQIIGNAGDGPVVLRYRMEGTGTDQRVQQRIYRSDSSFHDVDTVSRTPSTPPTLTSTTRTWPSRRCGRRTQRDRSSGTSRCGSASTSAARRMPPRMIPAGPGRERRTLSAWSTGSTSCSGAGVMLPGGSPSRRAAIFRPSRTPAAPT